jgi:hypothetical protein
MPGTIYNKHREIKPQRGRIVVAAAARRTGFMQADVLGLDRETEKIMQTCILPEQK